ncbi:MAG: hypothetical protein QGG23_00995 [Candidatus Bathyarchaeota archaeon]|jgi:hypothetical protein|nr:hypothetical protein [Candidatus Bathyarchaeota archaeon]MDP7207240.1 hypothetical protein [Candidatus Bathyarchaeota archaeon]MDP7443152.1 hypothetical protein [Candidatus Bathyarchaeota archaeon]|tara:strand:- start:416 stop:559 length:144 start_codon:yes stop_codon:yes gene_type:complete
MIYREVHIAFFVTLLVSVMNITIIFIRRGYRELGAPGIVASSLALTV